MLVGFFIWACVARAKSKGDDRHNDHRHLEGENAVVRSDFIEE